MNYSQRRDHFWRKAKDEGYRSRASYKLLQLQRRYSIFHTGDKVIDLGCAPGGWLQVIAEAVGPRGTVIGVDLQAVERLCYPNVHCVKGDIRDTGTRNSIRKHLQGFADVVTSDMSPHLSGIRFRDHHSSCELVRAGLDVCRELLRQGGAYLAKVFEGEELQDLHCSIQTMFGTVKRIVPDASRKGSAEVYVLARGYMSGKREIR